MEYLMVALILKHIKLRLFECNFGHVFVYLVNFFNQLLSGAEKVNIVDTLKIRGLVLILTINKFA